MSVIVFKGQSQYDSLRLFADEFADGLIDCGVKTHVVDLMEADFASEINQLLLKEKIEIVFAFNGVGCDFKLDDGTLLYDAMGAKYFAIYVDHPILHMERLKTSQKKSIATFIDNAHVDWANRFLTEFDFSAFGFLPHGGVESVYFSSMACRHAKILLCLQEVIRK